MSKEILATSKSSLTKAIKKLQDKIGETLKISQAAIAIPDDQAGWEELLRTTTRECNEGIANLNAVTQRMEKAGDKYDHDFRNFMEQNPDDKTEPTDYKKRRDDVDDQIDSMTEAIAKTQTFLMNVRTEIERKSEKKERENAKGQRETAQRVKTEAVTQSRPASPNVIPQEILVRHVDTALKMKLKVFTGNAWEWHTFSQMFDELTGKVQNLSDLAKLNYLITHLADEPLTIAESFILTGENFKLVYDSLKKRYGDEERIVCDLLKKLETIKSEGPQSKCQIKLKNDINAILTQLRIRGRKDVDESYMWWQKIIEKFNRPIRLMVLQKQVEAKLAEKKFTIEEIMSALDIATKVDELDSANRAKEESERKRNDSSNGNRFNRNSNQKNGSKQFNGSRQQEKLTKQTNADERSTDSPGLKQCSFCSKTNHASHECRTYSSSETRIKRLEELKKCTKCASPIHTTKDCKFHGKCYRCKNNGHYQFLCRSKVTDQKPNQKSKTGNQLQQKVDAPVLVTTAGNNVKSAMKKRPNKVKSGHLWIIQVCIQDPRSKEFKPFYALLDSGSEYSFIEKSVADELGLRQVDRERLEVFTMGASQPTSMAEQVVEICIKMDQTEKTKKKGRNSQEKKLSMALHVTPSITQRAKLPSLTTADWKYIDDQKLKMAVDRKDTTAKPQLLIGANHFMDFINKKQNMVKLPSGKLLMPTHVGYFCVVDQTPIRAPSKVHAYMVTAREPEEFGGYDAKELSETQQVDTSDPIEKEFIGPLHEEKKRTNELVQHFFDATIKKVAKGNKMAYEVRLPFKVDAATKIPDNRCLAWKRLQAVLRQLANNKELLNKYDETIKEQLEAGILEEVDEGIPPTGKRVCYLPHQHVITPNKTTSLRVVMDGSAAYKDSLSLNEILHQGPTIMPSLLGILMRFRMANKAMISDIQRAFLQVQLAEEDRDCTRILWVRNIDEPLTQQNLITLRFTAVLFGLICSPFLLTATIIHHLKNYPLKEDFKKEILDNLYVDNSLVMAETSEECLEKYKLLKRIFEDASMNLRQFTTNDQSAMQKINEVDKGNESTVKFLGIVWDSIKDVIMIPNIEKPNFDNKLTRRKILSFINSQYDPVGWRTPTLLPLKLYNRKVTEQGHGWDDTLPQELIAEFYSTVEKTVNQGYDIPRCICSSTDMKLPKQLVVFCDASGQALGAVIYLRDPMGKKADLLMSKGALANEAMTIVKKEMTALEVGMDIGALAYKQLADYLPIKEVVLLSDNSACVDMLKRPRAAQGKYIQNRIHTIFKIAREFEVNDVQVRFGHCKTNENIADVLTRPGADCRHWWKGPDLLISGQEDGLESRLLFPITDPKTEETAMTTVMLCNAVMNPKETQEETQVLDRSNSFYRTQKITAYVLRFIRNIIKVIPSETRREQIKKTLPSLTYVPDSDTHALTVYEIMIARRELIRIHQRRFFDMNFKKKHKNLDMTLDNHEIYCCGGRFVYANSLNRSSKFPIVIAPKSRLARLITLEIHSYYHRSHEHTIQDIRRIYWIPSIRQEVNPVIRNCVECQRFNNRPYPYPQMAPLPEGRVCTSRPFQRCGLDYLGPVSIKGRDEENAKAYVLLICCSTTRLLHLEVVTDLTTGTFLNAIRRFIARRGTPESITSDNAPTFLSGESLMAEAIENWRRERDSSFHEMLLQYQCEWKHSIAFAPWMGGMWERLCGSVKRAYQKTFGRKKLTLDEFTTAIHEIEGTLNSRPLTYRSADSLTLLRPCDFLQESNEMTFPIETLKDNEDEYLPSKEEAAIQTRQQAIKAMTSSIEMVEKYWNIWREYYLTDLRQKHKMHMEKKPGTKSEPRIGKVVLVVDNIAKRNDWQLGRIIKLITGKDGVTRGAKVKLGSGQMIERPVNLLVPLELDDDELVEPEVKEKMKTAKASQDQKKVDKDEPRYKLRPRKNVNYQNNSEDVEVDNCLTNVIGQKRTPSKTEERSGNQRWDLKWIVTGLMILTCFLPSTAEVIRASTLPPTKTPNDELEIPVFCREVRCWFCVDSITNPDCQPWIAIPLIVGMLALLVGLATGTILMIVRLGIWCYNLRGQFIQCCRRYRPHFHHRRSQMQNDKENERSSRQAGNNDDEPLNTNIRMAEIGVQTDLSKWRKTKPKTRTRRKHTTTEGEVESSDATSLRYDSKPESNMEDKRRERTSRVPTPLIINGRGESKYLFLIVITLLCFKWTTGMHTPCQKVFAASGSLVVCENGTNDMTTCHYETALALDLNSFHRAGCVILLNNKQEIARITVTWKNVRATCDEELLYHTRDVKIEYETTKRCPGMGMCTGDECRLITADTNLTDLAESNEYSGSSHCEESCGGLGCKCGGTASGCIFYRHFAKPRSVSIYRVMKCRYWDHAIDIDLQASGNGISQKMQTNSIELKPGLTVSMQNLSVTLASLEAPPHSEMFSQFMEKTSTKEWFTVPRGWIPLISCTNESQASGKARECSYNAECDCNTAQSGANCRCFQSSIKDKIEDMTENTIPFRRPGIGMAYHKGALTAWLTQDIMMKIDIMARVQTDGLALQVTEDKCSSKEQTVHVKGCYSCNTGALMNINCESTEYQLTATAICDTGMHFPLNCRPGGLLQTVAVSLHTPHPRVTCNITCGEKSSSFKITGLLHYDYRSAFETREDTNGTLIEHGGLEFLWPNIGGILSSLLNHPWIVLLTVTVILVAMIAITCACKKKKKGLKIFLCCTIVSMILVPTAEASPSTSPEPPIDQNQQPDSQNCTKVHLPSQVDDTPSPEFNQEEDEVMDWQPSSEESAESSESKTSKGKQKPPETADYWIQLVDYLDDDEYEEAIASMFPDERKRLQEMLKDLEGNRMNEGDTRGLQNKQEFPKPSEQFETQKQGDQPETSRAYDERRAKERKTPPGYVSEEIIKIDKEKRKKRREAEEDDGATVRWCLPPHLEYSRKNVVGRKQIWLNDREVVYLPKPSERRRFLKQQRERELRDQPRIRTVQRSMIDNPRNDRHLHRVRDGRVHPRSDVQNAINRVNERIGSRRKDLLNRHPETRDQLEQVDKEITRLKGIIEFSRRFYRVLDRESDKKCKLCEHLNSRCWHYEDNCPWFPTAEERMKEVDRSSRCPTCLYKYANRNHNRMCPGPRMRCHYCENPETPLECRTLAMEMAGREHNPALCWVPDAGAEALVDLESRERLRQELINILRDQMRREYECQDEDSADERGNDPKSGQNRKSKYHRRHK